MTGGQDADEASPGLCESYGTAVTDGSELYGLVRDSSAVHAHDDRYDGERMVVACSEEYMTALVAQFRARPFVDVELWVGKIGRAMLRHPRA